MAITMLETQNPPKYTRRDAAPPPYSARLPASFRVGHSRTEPVVIVEELQAHLHLLGEFHHLRTSVMDACDPQDRCATWSSFLVRSVERFGMWLDTASTDNGAFPPLDVLMVWHAYLLVRPIASVLPPILTCPCSLRIR